MIFLGENEEEEEEMEMKMEREREKERKREREYVCYVCVFVLFLERKTAPPTNTSKGHQVLLLSHLHPKSKIVKKIKENVCNLLKVKQVREKEKKNLSLINER